MKAAKFGIVFRFQFICRGNYYRRENNETMIYHSIYDLIMMWSGYGYGGGPTGGSHQNQIQLFNSILVGVTAIYLFSISMAATTNPRHAPMNTNTNLDAARATRLMLSHFPTTSQCCLTRPIANTRSQWMWGVRREVRSTLRKTLCSQEADCLLLFTIIIQINIRYYYIQITWDTRRDTHTHALTLGWANTRSAHA